MTTPRTRSIAALAIFLAVTVAPALARADDVTYPDAHATWGQQAPRSPGDLAGRDDTSYPAHAVRVVVGESTAWAWSDDVTHPTEDAAPAPAGRMARCTCPPSHG